MKTFRELIAWELEQDRKQKPSAADAKNGGSELNTTILRKLRYLNSNVTSSDRRLHQDFRPAC
jgi:hypothetical protein